MRYTPIKPLGDRVLVKIKSSEEKMTWGVLLPSSAKSKPQAGEVTSIGEGRTVGQNKVDIGVECVEVIHSNIFIFLQLFAWTLMSRRVALFSVEIETLNTELEVFLRGKSM
ncbi:hypothetical protein KSP39_PZI002276 [Platanthera zijinensis]|uniref:10 kDa chaperonin n=1 Tax=Platanthera zijinensis TaxID=2320716 RepID=A0AAP0GEE7_9ASPA